MAGDVLVNRAAAIERAVRRVREEYAGDDRNLLENVTRQDAIILNLQRACEGPGRLQGRGLRPYFVGATRCNSLNQFNTTFRLPAVASPFTMMKPCPSRVTS